jgi:thiol:disulfide interchange protein
MKKILPALVFSLLSLTISAQILNPVKWSFKTEKISDTEFELVFTAKIDDGWYIHSQFITGDGPIPTSINFDKNKQLRFAGKIAESGEKEKEEFDEVWGFVVKKFYKKSVFRQRVIVDDLNTIVRGSIEFGTCNEITGVCLPPAEIDFSFSFPKSDNSLQLTVKSNEADSQKLIVIDSGQDTSYSAQSDTNSITSDIQSSSSIIIPEAKNENPKSLWGIFIAGFIGGLLALLTPCVFPIIPMTVSFFTKTSKDRNKGIANAVLYGLAIIVIYVGLGFIVTKALGADALNDMASSAFFNLAFFVIFVVFAVSFFGYFEITLPSSFVNKMDSMSDRGGLIGIFFMAFTLSLVSFSCTGPIIGTLLVEAAMGGSNTGPLIGMFGFSLALALPFGLFAAFPAWLNSLPKSGGWLNSVKVILGFLELGLALKFLSNVDLPITGDF